MDDQDYWLWLPYSQLISPAQLFVRIDQNMPQHKFSGHTYHILIDHWQAYLRPYNA